MDCDTHEPLRYNITICPECLSTHVSGPASDKLMDCLDCGVWWDPANPNNHPDSPYFGQPLPEGEFL